MPRVPALVVGLLLAAGSLGAASACGPDDAPPAPTSKMRVVPEIVEGVICDVDADRSGARQACD